MVHTEFSWLGDDELLRLVDGKGDATPLERELAARLTDALNEKESLSDELDATLSQVMG